ncbi:nuclear transport factor 2 family protein [Hellea sp.]|nr:nuclear transport factor 2 family protein [Hellea sp.]
MRVLLLGLTGLYLASCGQASTPRAMSAQEAFETYVAALNAGDIATAAAYYDRADGFHWIERGHVQYETGEDAANSLLALQANGGTSEMTLDTLRVSKLTNDSALISTHFDFEMRSDNGTPQFSFDGWMTVGMVRRSEGWKIAGGQTGPGKTE